MRYVRFICFFVLLLLSFLCYGICFFFFSPPLFLTVVLQKNHASFFKSPIDRHLVVPSLLLLGCCTEYTHE